jgi:hypothetical protein
VRVSATQALSDHLHHPQREARRLFHQPQESFLIDGGNAAINSCHRGGAAGFPVDESHLSEHATGGYAFDYGAPQVNLDGSFDDREHALARVALFEDRLALPESTNVRLATQDIESWHGGRTLTKLIKPAVDDYD